MQFIPASIKTSYVRFSNRVRMEKNYRASFVSIHGSKFSRRSFKTASQALEYGGLVVKRYQRLIDAMPQPEETQPLLEQS